jgi:HK97 family phage portal protein
VAGNFLTSMARAVGISLKAVVPITVVPATAAGGSFWGAVRESYSGAWQNAATADPDHTLLAFSAVYACVTLIAADISKLRIKLMRFDRGVWQETENSAFSPVLRKPNRYQTRIQFLNQWIQSKLIYGNTYVLKDRDARGVVIALYVLDPRRVKPLITEDGQVFYSIGTDRLIGSNNVLTVPASEIIHDRAVCFFHPLIGVGPLYAAGLSATQGNRIQSNGMKFFQNMSRPSGQLTAPGEISDETAERLKREFEGNFSGGNLGRMFVAGDGLKYEPMTIPAAQAQMIEQLGWTVQDVARAFHMPLHKIAADSGEKFANMAAKNQDYYSQTLQVLIEEVELLLDEGLGLTGGPQSLGVSLDLEGLLRMDPVARAQRTDVLTKAGVMAINEARATEDLLPITGGEEPFLQQQNYPLSVLIKQPPPGSTPPPAAPPALPAPDAAANSAADAAAKWMADFEQRLVDQAKSAEVAADERAARTEAAATAQINLIKEMSEQILTATKTAPVEEDSSDVEDFAAALIAKFTAVTNA